MKINGVISAALAIFLLGKVFSNVLGLIHEPIECWHFKLSFELITDDLSNSRIVTVQPLFL